MPIYDIFSKRRDDENRATVDVYQYASIPPPLRSQIKRITLEALGSVYEGYILSSWRKNSAYDAIEGIYCREVGIDSLGRGNSLDNIVFAIDNSETDQFLDILELICRMIDGYARKYDANKLKGWNIIINATEALEEINYRLRRAGLGYQFESGQIIRQDSTFVHDAVIKPALELLSNPKFSGIEEEFLAAHRYYREGEFEQSVVEAAKSFESMMKAVCDDRGWAYGKGARASDLIKVMKQHRFFPDYLDNSFDQLIATLTSGLPKVRNDSGAHGQGSTPRNTPPYIAAYTLSLAASKIVLLGKILADLP